MWPPQDLTCANCRNRKIRCDRKRPRCGGCQRNGIECQYLSPEKRINHIKLLCHKVDALGDRLTNIEDRLSILTSLANNDNIPKPVLFGDDTDNRVMHDEISPSDRYHSPQSLLLLCKGFRDDPIFKASSPLNQTEGESPVHSLLQKLCLDASRDGPEFRLVESVGISLPPRQHLDRAMENFFKSANYVTDIFVRSLFQKQVNHIYMGPLSLSDEAWAVCFNAVAFLGTEVESASSDATSPLQTILATIQSAMCSYSLLLRPRLINVQVLALLSHIAELYSSAETTETLLTQAFILARRIGLHQTEPSYQSLPAEELCERQMVFQSLYIRDKHLAIARGSQVWLSRFHSAEAPPEAQLRGYQHHPRIELARIQDEIHFQSHLGSQHKHTASRNPQPTIMLKQKLDDWAARHGIGSQPIQSVDSACLLISFLATRLYISSSDTTQLTWQHLFGTVSATCAVFLQAMESRAGSCNFSTLDQSLYRNGLSSVFNGQHVKSRGDGGPAITACLITSFPLSGLFIMARHVLKSPSYGCGEPLGANDGTLLLEALRDRFDGAGNRSPLETFPRKISRIIDALLEIIHQKWAEGSFTPHGTLLGEFSSPIMSHSLNGGQCSCRTDPAATPSMMLTTMESMAQHIVLENLENDKLRFHMPELELEWPMTAAPMEPFLIADEMELAVKDDHISFHGDERVELFEVEQ